MARRRRLRTATGVGLEQFPVATAWGKHLFPFRTEQLSPTAPMVLGSQGPGRVGRRRFLLRAAFGRLVLVKAPGPGSEPPPWVSVPPVAPRPMARGERRAPSQWRTDLPLTRSAPLYG